MQCSLLMLYLLIVVTGAVNTTLFLCSICLQWLQAQSTLHYPYALFAYSGCKPSEHYIILMLYLLIVVRSPVNTTLFLCSICLQWLQAQSTLHYSYALFAYSDYNPSQHYIILMLYLLIVVASPVITTLLLCSICLQWLQAQ